MYYLNPGRVLSAFVLIALACCLDAAHGVCEEDEPRPRKRASSDKAGDLLIRLEHWAGQEADAIARLVKAGRVTILDQGLPSPRDAMGGDVLADLRSVIEWYDATVGEKMLPRAFSLDVSGYIRFEFASLVSEKSEYDHASVVARLRETLKSRSVQLVSAMDSGPSRGQPGVRTMTVLLSTRRGLDSLLLGDWATTETVHHSIAISRVRSGVSALTPNELTSGPRYTSYRGQGALRNCMVFAYNLFALKAWGVGRFERLEWRSVANSSKSEVDRGLGELALVGGFGALK